MRRGGLLAKTALMMSSIKEKEKNYDSWVKLKEEKISSNSSSPKLEKGEIKESNSSLFHSIQAWQRRITNRASYLQR